MLDRFRPPSFNLSAKCISLHNPWEDPWISKIYSLGNQAQTAPTTQQE
jgi:hypothetical protein